MGRSIYLTQGDVFTEVQSTKVNIPPRSGIEAIDRGNILHMYCMVSAQQTNLLPKYAY